MGPMPHTARKSEHDLDHGALLRSAGMRVTPVRLGVLRTLCQTHIALTADQIIEELARARPAKAKQGVRRPDRVTVYRTLSALVDSGIAHRLDPGDRVFRFGLSGDHAAHAPAATCGCGPSENCGHPAIPPTLPSADDQGHGHPHFLCETCGKVECLEDTEVVLKPKAGRPQSGMNVRRHQVLLKGTCGECGPPGAGAT